MLSVPVLGRFVLVGLWTAHALGNGLVQPGYRYEFPRDYFEHRDFAMEWWYYTGNLADREGRRFGYELTFFRAAPGNEASAQTSWDLDQVYVAHFVVTDVQEQRLIHRERANRGGPGLAGASAANGTIWNGNWSVEYHLDDTSAPTQTLRAWDEAVSLELSLEPTKQHVLHGTDGISRKGGEVGQASHYLSFTHMRTTGTLAIGDSVYDLQGQSWMDHEFFGESMASDLSGWDWLSIQLDDQTEVMIAGIRLPSGRYSSYSHGTFVGPHGRTTHLTSEDIRLVPGRIWQSATTGAEYPVEWTLQVSSIGLSLAVRALHDAQEIVSQVASMPTYWEGPVDYSGSRGEFPVSGSGYLEMTGYDARFRLALE